MSLFGKKKKGTEETAPEASPAESEPVNAAQPKEPAAPKLKIRPDFYTLLLGLSVAALLIASILLYLNVEAYGPDPISSLPKVN